MPAGKGDAGGKGASAVKGQSGSAELRLPLALEAERGAGRPVGRKGRWGAALGKLASRGAGVAGVGRTAAVRAPNCLPPSLPEPRKLLSRPPIPPPGPGVSPCQPPTCSRIAASGFGWESSLEESRAAPGPGPRAGQPAAGSQRRGRRVGVAAAPPPPPAWPQLDH